LRNASGRFVVHSGTHSDGAAGVDETKDRGVRSRARGRRRVGGAAACGDWATWAVGNLISALLLRRVVSMEDESEAAAGRNGEFSGCRIVD
jgi:hypothetical protein